MERFFRSRGSSKFRNYKAVRLEVDLPHEDLKAGMIGIVTEVYSGTPPSYKVEFVDIRGETLESAVVREPDLSSF